MPRQITKPRVYSYLRFSTPEQKLGDSERRQLELAEAFAKRKKLPLDESLRDEGLSGYHGTHRKKGSLGKFLKRIEAGEIPKGSILVVENIDRLGREDVLTALETITTIINREISIVTLSPYEAEYTRESINNGMIYQLVGDIKRANAESEMKSQRVRAARKQAKAAARDLGRMMTARVPAWFDPEKAKNDRVCEIIPEAVACVNQIFEWKLQGVGLHTIAEKLNKQGGWKRPSGWRASYVKKILQNRAVIGEYQPHIVRDGKRLPDGDPIYDYYPQIVENELFFAVQKITQQNRGSGGRKDKCNNLLTHIAKCAYCGGIMRFVDKGKPPKGQQYLRCDNGYRGVCCDRYMIRYDEVETLVLKNCAKLKPEQVLPNPDQQTKQCKALKQNLAGKAAEISDIDTKLDNFANRVGDAPSNAIADRIYSEMGKLEEQKAQIEKAIQETEQELREASLSLNSFKTWTNSLAEMRKAITSEDSVEVRLKLRLHLTELIDRVEIFAHGYKERMDPDERQHPTTKLVNGKRKYVPAPPQQADDFVEVVEAKVVEFNPDLWNDEQFRSFVEHVAEQRMTRKGRFIRVFFKTGAIVDLVPPGSLADGMEMVHDKRRRIGWRFVSPKIFRMWQDYQTNYRKRR